MTEGEWGGVCAIIVANWPHQVPPPSALAKWHGDVDDLPVAQVVAAVEAIAADGEHFPPNGHRIRAKVTELSLDAPEWVEASALLGSIFDKPETLMTEDGSVPVRANHIATLPPLIQAFVAKVGLEALNRGLVGGSEEARLRDKWTTFVTRAQRDRNYAQIPSAGLAALERSSEGPKPIGQIVKQIQERNAA